MIRFSRPSRDRLVDLSWAPVAAGGSLAELASPSIAALNQNVIGSMFMTKLKTIAVCVLLIVTRVPTA